MGPVKRPHFKNLKPNQTINSKNMKKEFTPIHLFDQAALASKNLIRQNHYLEVLYLALQCMTAEQLNWYLKPYTDTFSEDHSRNDNFVFPILHETINHLLKVYPDGKSVRAIFKRHLTEETYNYYIIGSVND